MWMRKREDFYFLFGTIRLRLKCSFAVDGVNVYTYTEIEDIIKMIYVNSFSFLIWSYWNGMIVEVKKKRIIFENIDGKLNNAHRCGYESFKKSCIDDSLGVSDPSDSICGEITCLFDDSWMRTIKPIQ